jgi:hypothetical protein
MLRNYLYKHYKLPIVQVLPQEYQDRTSDSIIIN